MDVVIRILSWLTIKLYERSQKLLLESHRSSSTKARLIRQKDTTQAICDSAKEATKSIVITTFSARFYDFCLPLVMNLRAGGVTEPIYVVINSDWLGQTDFPERSRFISKLSEHKDVFPISLGAPCGMAKIWNLGIRAAGADYTLVLNDDTIIDKASISRVVKQVYSKCADNDLIIVNRTFGHFAISKECLVRVGLFDERYLGFGEEDGDFYWRFEQAYKQKPFHLDNVPGIINSASETGHEHLVKASGSKKYSLFNLLYCEAKYEFDSGGPQGIFETGRRKVIPEPTYAETVDWERELGELVSEEEPALVREKIRAYLDRSSESTGPIGTED